LSNPPFAVVFWIAVGLLGLITGSFLNAVIHRLPLGVSLLNPRRSFCPGCGKTISWSENLPVASWILLRGRCSGCAMPIALRYPLVELLTGGLYLLVWGRFGLPLAPVFWIFLSLLVAATFIDFDHLIIPDEITLGGTAAGMLCATLLPGLLGEAVWWRGLLWSGLGVACGYCVLWGVVELGKLAFGRRKLCPEQPMAFELSGSEENPELLLGEEPDLYVAEVSSFQLETIRTFRPKVALWLNLSPNHLDRYPSMAEYREAKLRIFLNQTEEDWAVVQHGSELPPIKARTITFSTTDSSADLTLEQGTKILHHGSLLIDMSGTRLRGPHNAANLMAAFAAGIALGTDLSSMAAAVGDYSPPAHRCELVAERDGVRWINDSKATNLDAMEQAIRSVDGPLILMAGGKDKGFEFSPIAPLVRERVSRAILIGEMRHRIARDWAPVETVVVDTLDEAVASAAAAAGPGYTVLFSPGTSSFDMFRDYVRRGEEFRRLVLALPQQSPTR